MDNNDRGRSAWLPRSDSKRNIGPELAALLNGEPSYSTTTTGTTTAASDATTALHSAAQNRVYGRAGLALRAVRWVYPEPHADNYYVNHVCRRVSRQEEVRAKPGQAHRRTNCAKMENSVIAMGGETTATIP